MLESTARVRFLIVNYRDYIHSEAWRERRLAKLEQAKYRCAKCGERDNLNVHHLNYDHLGNELSSDLIVLCRAHHWVADEIRKGRSVELEYQLDQPPEKSREQDLAEEAHRRDIGTASLEAQEREYRIQQAKRKGKRHTDKTRFWNTTRALRDRGITW